MTTPNQIDLWRQTPSAVPAHPATGAAADSRFPHRGGSRHQPAQQAKNLHYGLDFCPAFWQWLLDNHAASRVFSIDKEADALQLYSGFTTPREGTHE
jgi:hypothetical protein